MQAPHTMVFLDHQSDLFLSYLQPSIAPYCCQIKWQNINSEKSRRWWVSALNSFSRQSVTLLHAGAGTCVLFSALDLWIHNSFSHKYSVSTLPSHLFSGKKKKYPLLFLWRRHQQTKEGSDFHWSTADSGSWWKKEFQNLHSLRNLPRYNCFIAMQSWINQSVIQCEILIKANSVF